LSEEAARYAVNGKSKYSYDFESIDLRRTWLVAGAIATLPRPTVTSISKELGFRKSTVQRIAEKLQGNEFPALKINVDGVVLSIESWGILNGKIVKEYYNDFLQVRT